MGAPAVEQIYPRELNLCQCVHHYPRVTSLAAWDVALQLMNMWEGYWTPWRWWLWSFVCLVGIRGFLSIANRSVPVVRHSTLVTPHLSLHTCHSLFVTLSVMVSFFFTPWQEVRRVSFGSCFSCWLPGEQWSFRTSAHSLPPIAQSLPVLSKVGFLCAQDTTCALGYMSSDLLKSVLFTLDQGLQSQGITGYQRPLCWTERERCTAGPEKFWCWTKSSRTQESLQNRFAERSQLKPNNINKFTTGPRPHITALFGVWFSKSLWKYNIPWSFPLL